MSSRNCTCQPKPFTRSASLRATSNDSPVLAVRLTRKPRTPPSARSRSSRSVMLSPISAMPRSAVGMRLDGVDDEAVVGAVKAGLHHDAALEAGGAEHGEIVVQDTPAAACRGGWRPRDIGRAARTHGSGSRRTFGGSVSFGLRMSRCGPAHIGGLLGVVHFASSATKLADRGKPGSSPAHATGHASPSPGGGGSTAERSVGRRGGVNLFPQGAPTPLASLATPPPRREGWTECVAMTCIKSKRPGLATGPFVSCC